MDLSDVRANLFKSLKFNGKLVPKEITVHSKSGDYQAVRMVDPDKDNKKPRKPKAQEEEPEHKPKAEDTEKDKQGAKVKKSTDEVVADLMTKHPHLDEADIRTRLAHGIPYDASNVHVYSGDPKRKCEYNDNKGRKQIRYTDSYIKEASEKKFQRIENIQENLLNVRKKVNKDLKTEGMGKDKVCALVVKLIDSCYFRIGNEKYTEENGTHGITTMEKEHIKIKGNRVDFEYVGKASKAQHQFVVNKELAGLIDELQKSPDKNLFQYKDGNIWHKLDDVDVRKYLSKYNMKPKDFRTYHATRICADKLNDLGGWQSEKERDKKIDMAIKHTAELLGHTPAICRSNYINGKVLDLYKEGLMGGYNDGKTK